MFGPLLQLRELLEMLAQFDEALLMPVLAALPADAERSLVANLQAFFVQLQPQVMRRISDKLKGVGELYVCMYVCVY